MSTGPRSQNFHVASFASFLRIETAMEADIQRLENECRLYRETTNDEKTRQASQLRTFQASFQSDNVTAMEDSLRQELEELHEICANEQAELDNLTKLLRDAELVSQQLDDYQDNLNEQANALELETHAFQNEEQQVVAALTQAQDEVERLSKDIRLTTRYLDLRVDRARGLLYPLINELRLAYRPKGDVQWEEIQSAWALAAQLLLHSITLLNFSSQHWRIVPLSQCAKIIYHAPQHANQPNHRGVTYNVGHPSSRSNEALMAWNKLLAEVVQHALTTIQSGIEKGLVEASRVEKLPYEQTKDSIGGVPLRHLDADDDASWSRVVHFLSCNLLWLANVASLWTLEDVVLSAVNI